ncbi:hypothetical protein MTX26_15925 [Bradyrhizobium sp. ISRA443]|uniref:hypothetical protein n=1 Tax=unclassified Bradyrhizobium TaxID=2631580 RepID=UPI00247A0D45|nr:MULTISPECIES: hypothetical protein [unclassified Bradyrhizobium]WGR91849.1 hypothetical protein MTX20_26495 [Bradyrhizobium sp. ISRA435]WGS02216.1 hypothetical protein MTX23_15935 [Bradyrhizobium sp. ISRA436]WGS09101.1 hypothetical protein MTX18_15925 [Bradyrhizobium sp. ISRA437]WGS15990.1 hypothetical protein MTX26_15925 [Bradyrhizobium sp. ISRA443]
MTAAAPIKILTAAAEKRALLCAYGEMEVQAAVDGLQYYAARAGLLDELGQDRVQDVIAAAFIWAHEHAEAEADFAYDPDYGRQIIARWEAEDAKRPPVEEASEPTCRTPAATVDAFWIVVDKDDPDYLAEWLAEHPLDAEHLHKIWRRKCSIAAAA